MGVDESYSTIRYSDGNIIKCCASKCTAPKIL